MLITETQILPPISTYSTAIEKGGLMIEAFENYQKKSLRNRFFLASPQGRTGLSIPLKKGKANQKTISKVEISYDEDWIQNVNHTLSTLLSRAAFYEFYYEELMNIFHTRFKYLFDLNNELLKWSIERGRIEISFSFTSSYKKQYDDSFEDLRGMPLSYYHDYPSNKSVDYDQIFMLEHGFIRNLSILDLLMHRGPETGMLIKRHISNLRKK